MMIAAYRLVCHQDLSSECRTLSSTYAVSQLMRVDVVQSEKGEICVNTLKKDWKKEFGIAHILTTIKWSV